jgi:hypothetical protein
MELFIYRLKQTTGFRAKQWDETHADPECDLLLKAGRQGLPEAETAASQRSLASSDQSRLARVGALARNAPFE